MTNDGPFRYRLPGRRAATGEWDAAAIAALRARLGLTQAELAGEIGVRQQTVSEWETGRYRPRGASARLLAFLAESDAPYGAGSERRP